jgi:hypothetical protein
MPQPIKPLRVPLRALAALTAAALLLTLAAAATATAGAADLKWSAPQQIDNAGTPGIAAYACPSATQCTAVDSAGQEVTFNPDAVGDPSRTLLVPAGNLLSVACPSTTECIAGFATLAFGVPGTRNVVTFNPQDPSSAATVLINADGLDLRSLSCPTTTQCTSIAIDITGNNGAVVTFDPHVSSAPTRTVLDPANPLGAVTCPTARQCTAAGHDGRLWTFNPQAPGSPVAYGTGAGDFTRVTCPTTTQCTGIDFARTMVTVDLTGPNVIDSVASFPGNDLSCVSNSDCYTGDTSGNLIAFDPSHWFDRRVTRVGASAIRVVCTTTTHCLAAGSTGAGAINPQAPSAPSLTPIDRGAGLAGLWCPSEHQCSSLNTVGQLVTFDPQAPAGRTTAAMPAAVVGGLACPAMTRCVMADATGQGYTFDPHAPADAVPYALDTGHQPSTVACPSATLCVLLDRDSGMVVWDPTAPGGATRSEPIDGGPQLTVLSCPTATQCSVATSIGQIATFNPQAPAARSQFSVPTGVMNLVCVTASQCLATDYTGARETFDPHVGDITVTAMTGGRFPLYIACRTADACVWTTTTGVLLQANPQIEGGATTLSQVPGLNLPYGVACPGADLCAVVDNSGNLSVGTVPPAPPVTDTPAPPASPATPAAPARPATPVSPIAAPRRITDAAVKTLLRKLLAAGGGSLTPSFMAPAAGRLTIRWTTKVGKRTVTIASGTFTYKKASARAAKVKLKLTKAGKSLLKHHKKLKVTAKATYRMTGRKTITATRTFTLKKS